MVDRISPFNRFRAFGYNEIDKISQLKDLPKDYRVALKAAAAVLPFRVNSYVIEELVDWDNIPSDPMFQLIFPQPGMLSPQELKTMIEVIQDHAPRSKIKLAAQKIQKRLNPHPSNQMDLNVPIIDGQDLPGIQHKYRETILFFPAQGQTCHTYCTYCFRWAQFIGDKSLKFAASEGSRLKNYLASRPRVTDILFTGGDPLTIKTKTLRKYMRPLFDKPTNLRTIRIGTKAPTFWPFRFLTDQDADDLLRLFEEIIENGLHLAIMIHVSHPRELETAAAESAIRRIRNTGAVIRCQTPLIRHVNDSSDLWAEMWRRQVSLGIIPYYMFVERDTGPKHYFEVPLVRALEIFQSAYSQVSGLARTVRGPVMSATPGKILVDGMLTIDNNDYFVLKMLQARDPDWVNKLFLAHGDPKASWLDQLKPALGQNKFFFEDAITQMLQKRRHT